MRYATARYTEKQGELAYRIYVSDCLRITTKNTAKFAGGSFMEADFRDVLKPKQKDNRTAEELVADIIQRAGIKVI